MQPARKRRNRHWGVVLTFETIFSGASTVVMAYAGAPRLLVGIFGFAAVVFFVALFGLLLTRATRRGSVEPAGPAEVSAKKTRRSRSLAATAVIFGVVGATAFVLAPVGSGRAYIVPLFAAIALLLTFILAARSLFRFARGDHRRPPVIVLAAVIALEGVLVGGLNAYADTQSAPAISAVQDYYAEVADAVSLGDAIHAGHGPAGVTFEDVYNRSNAVWEETFITSLNVPDHLLPYVDSIHQWASAVSLDAFSGELAAGDWKSISYQPDPIQVSLRSDQADAALTVALEQTAGLVQAGNRAIAAKDVRAMAYVAARLDAQAYWLQAIETSADPNWIAAHFHFLPAPTNPLATASVDSDLRMVASRAATARSWPSFRSPAPRPNGARTNRRCFLNCSSVLKPVGVLWHAAFTYAYSPPTTADPAPWNGAEQQLLPLIGADFNGQSIEGSGSGVDTSEVPPKAFSDQCSAEGGVMGGTVWDRTKARVPTSEPGWTCRTHGGACFWLRTFSGADYRGGDPGCPEYGLLPLQFGPLDGVFRWLGNGIVSLIPAQTNGAPGPPSSTTWDGSYNVRYGQMNCRGSGGESLALGLGRALTDPVVTNGGVSELEGSGRAPIDASGHASYVYGSGTAEVVSEHFTFTKSAGGGAAVSGDYDVKIFVSAGNPGGPVTVTGQLSAECSGQFSGPRT